jgi:uncharacterized protein YjiS (DUF1127 family)
MTSFSIDIAEVKAMTSTSANMNSAAALDATSHERSQLFTLIMEVVSVCARAQAAARHYEELKHLSDEALAQRGLMRADVPRAAFDKLSK